MEQLRHKLAIVLVTLSAVCRSECAGSDGMESNYKLMGPDSNELLSAVVVVLLRGGLIEVKF